MDRFRNRLTGRSQDSGKKSGPWNLFGHHKSKTEQCLAGTFGDIPGSSVGESKNPARKWKNFWKKNRSMAFIIPPQAAPEEDNLPKDTPIGVEQNEVDLQKLPPTVRKKPPKTERRSIFDIFCRKPTSTKLQPPVPKYKTVGTQVSEDDFNNITMASTGTDTDQAIKVSVATQVEERDLQVIPATSSLPVPGKYKIYSLPPIETPGLRHELSLSKPLPQIRIPFIVVRETKAYDRVGGD